MSKINTFLAVIGMVFLAFSANAQLSYTLVPSTTTPALGETITVDVVVNGFTDIASYQYSINWNPSHFSYQGVSNFNLTGLNAGNFGTTQTGMGRLGTLWSDPFAASQSLPDGTSLFTLTLEVISASAVTSDIVFSGLPVGMEVIQDQGGSLTEITGMVDFNDSTIEIDGGGGGSTGIPCNFLGFGITVTSDSAATGDPVCLDIAVCNFTDILGVSYTMEFDPTKLQFDNITNLNLVDLEGGSFGTNNAGNGQLTLAWFDPNGVGVTVPDETVIYSVCFTAIGAGGDVDSLLINGALAQIDITNTSSNGNNIGLESIDGEVKITGSSASAVTILASQEQGSPGDTVTVDVTVRNFDSIIGLQYSMLWDPMVLEFYETQWAGNLPGVPTFNTSAVLTDAGKLTFLWTDPAAEGVPLPDDELLFSIRYIIVGAAADESVIDFTSDPTSIEVSQVVDGSVEVVPLAKIPGLVEVVGEGVLTLNIGTAAGATGDTVCVPITVQNFNEIVSIQYDVSWNTSELQYINTEGFNLNGLSTGNFNPIGSNRLRLSWVEALLSPQTIPDGDTLYSMCFEILAMEGVTPEVVFDQTQTIEFTSGAGATNVDDFVVNDGDVTIIPGGAPMEVSDTTITNVLCNGDATGAIDITIVNSVGTVAYNWSPGGQSTQDISGLSAGTYMVTITDDNVTLTQTYTITEPSALTQTSSSTDITCNGDDDGTATVTPAGGTTDYTYAWSPGGGSTATITGLSAGTYTVTVTDANMCTVTASETIDEPTALSVSTSAQDVTVNGGNDGEATATPSGGTTTYTYAWSPGGGSTATITGLTAGTYTVTVTDVNMCTATSSVSVGEPGSVSASITASSNVSCNGLSDGTATVTPGGGVDPYDFVWSSNAGMTATVTNLPANTYSVTVTDANGATATASVTITEPTAVTASVSDDNVSCNGLSDGTATVTPGGGAGNYSYEWDTNPLETTAMITGLAPGQYSVTVTDDDGCTADGTTFVSEPNALTLSGSVTHESSAGANNGTITITPGGGIPGYVFDWQDIGGTDDPQNRSSLSPGSYTVTMTDANDCTISETFTVNQFDAPQITVDNVVNIDCNGDNTGAINISVSGGLTPYSFLWTGGAVTEDTSNLAAGNYTITVTDNIGTTAVETITVSEATAITVAVDGQTNVSCNGGSDGSINISVSGGTTPYSSYDWGGGITVEDPSGLSAGTYTVTVTDANGCTQVGAPVTITEPSIIAIGVVSATNINCNGDATGSIDITVTGGTTPYASYDWGSGITVQDPIGLTAGTYTVTVTDANGCTQIGPAVSLSEPTAITALSNTTPISCNGAADGTISLNVSGGVPGGGAGYDFNWSPTLPNQANHTGVSPGTYNVTITDAVGCTIVEGPIAVTQPSLLTVSNTVTNASAANNDGMIDLTVTGGTPAYSFDWSNGATSEDLSNLSSGCYAVTVSDLNGCEVVDSIKVGGIIAITSTITDVSCAGICDGEIDIEVLGGIAPYTYSWAGAGVVGNSEDQNQLCAGNYSVTVADSNGSLTSQTFTVGTPTALTISNSIIENETGNGCNGSINITVTGGTLPYAYQWSNGADNEDPINLCKGNYDVTISDANGCALLASYTILPPPLVVSTSSMTMVSCNGDTDGEVCLSVLGGCGPYTLTIGGQTQVTVSGEDVCFSGLAAGAQTVNVVDDGTPQMTVDHNFTILQPDPVSIAILTSVNNTDPTGANCNGSIDIQPSGGTGTYSYLWSNGEISQDLDNVCESPPSYCVTVTDENGCTASICEELDLGLNVSIVSSNNVSCFGDCDGAADIEVFGGIAPYTYIWGPSGQTVQDPSNLCAGIYTVTITDSSVPAIQVTTTVTIDEPAEALSVTIESTTNPTGDAANGSITLDINGGWGVTNDNIVWSDGGTGNPRGGLVEGFYTATITDNNGCIEIISVELTAFRLMLSFEETEPSCNGDTDGQLEVFVSGGSGDYTYEWSSADSGDNLAFNLGAGLVTVTVTDNVIAGLSATETVDLQQPDLLTVEPLITPATGPADGIIEAEVTGGTPEYTFVWTNGENTRIITRLAAGTYGLQVTDANGCNQVIPEIIVPIEGECLQAREVITPNNDGKNDNFEISCIEGLNNNLKVFNRWGQMVYEVDNYDNSWSGTGFDDLLLPESGYFWVLEYDEDGQTKQLKGAFTLLRGDK